jgi:hypothetical protein
LALTDVILIAIALALSLGLIAWLVRSECRQQGGH